MAAAAAVAVTTTTTTTTTATTLTVQARASTHIDQKHSIRVPAREQALLHGVKALLLPVRAVDVGLRQHDILEEFGEGGVPCHVLKDVELGIEGHLPGAVEPVDGVSISVLSEVLWQDVQGLFRTVGT